MSYDYDADQPNDPQYMWKPSVHKWLNGVEPFTNNKAPEEYQKYTTAAGYVTKEFGELQKDSNEAKKFYSNLLADEVLTTRLSDNQDPESPEFATGSTAALPMGLYLMDVTSRNPGKVYFPQTVAIVPTWDQGSSTWKIADANIVVKHTNVDAAVTAGVKVNGLSSYDEVGTLAIGETAEFKMEITLPKYDESIFSNPTMTIMVPSNKSLTVGELTLQGKTAAGDSMTLEKNTDYVDSGVFSGGFDLVYANVKDYQSIVVTADVTMTSAATVQGDSPHKPTRLYASFTYDDGSVAGYSNIAKQIPFFTYGVSVSTFDATNSDAPLAGATYGVWMGESPNQGIDAARRFVKLADGTYRLATQEEITAGGTVRELVATSDGTLKIYGFNKAIVGQPGPIIKQVKAPAGYNLVADEKAFRIIDNDPDGIVDYQTSGYEPISFKNGKGFTLPTTGGIGTAVLPFAGVLMLGVCALVVVTFKHRSSSTDA